MLSRPLVRFNGNSDDKPFSSEDSFGLPFERPRKLFLDTNLNKPTKLTTDYARFDRVRNIGILTGLQTIKKKDNKPGHKIIPAHGYVVACY